MKNLAMSRAVRAIAFALASALTTMPGLAVDAGDRAPPAHAGDASWTAMAGGMSGSVNALTVHQGRVVAGGGFLSAGGVTVNRIAAWDGEQWQPFGSGADGGIHVVAGFGSRLIVAGGFDHVGGVAADGLAQWTGSGWSSLPGSPFVSVDHLIVHGGELIVAGTGIGPASMEHIAKWNGTTWSPLGAGLDSSVDALGVHGGELIVAADLPWPQSGAAIWAWNGSSWRVLEDSMNGRAGAFATWNGQLVAAGRFTSIGGVSANRIARWDGQAWSPLGAGIGSQLQNQRVEALAVHAGELWAFGFFERAGGQPASHVARWNGSAWSTTGSGTDATASTALSHGGALYVGGAFVGIDGVPVNYVARRFADAVFASGFE